MFSFSINPTIDMSGIDFNVKTEEGRKWLSQVFERAYYGELSGGDHPRCNVDAYAYSARKKAEAHTAVTETPILTESELEAGYKGVVAELAQHEQLITNFDDGYTFRSYEEEQLYKQGLEEFIDMREYIFIEDNIDIVELLLNATASARDAIAKVQKLIKDYVGLGELITNLIECGDWRSMLLRLQAKPICALN